MKMALTDGMVRIIEADAIQKTIIKSWNQMRWIRGQQMYEGIASTELLNKLAIRKRKDRRLSFSLH